MTICYIFAKRIYYFFYKNKKSVKKTILSILYLIVNLTIVCAQDTTKSNILDTNNTVSGLDKIQQDRRILDLTYSGDKSFLWSEKVPDYIRTLNIGGYLRLCTEMRNMKQPYYGGVEGKTIFAGDEGYSEPLLLLNIGGKASKNSSFMTDLHFTNYFTGPNNSPTLNSHFTVGFTGTMTTSFARINVRLGGLHWYELTDLTLGSISKIDRYSIFERSPWEPYGEVNEKYDNYYDKGSISKDARWGKREFQGVILETSDLPKSLFVKAMYGKTSQNGDYTSVLPNNVFGGQIGKSLSTDQYISLNTFNKTSYSDSVHGKPVGYNIHTIAWNFTKGKVILRGEAGAGDYYSPNYPIKFSEGIKFKVSVPKDATWLPFEFQLVRLGKYFVNENAGFANTTIHETFNVSKNGTTQAQSQTTNYPFHSPIVDGDDLTNNRQGGCLFLEKSVTKKIKIRLGLGISQEIEKGSNQLSYNHRINSLVMNRVVTGWNWWTGAVFGPYSRTYGMFRGIYEVVNITDSNYSKKHFNNLDFQIKFKQKLFGNPLYFFYNYSYKSAQSNFSAVPVFDDKAWIRQGIHEIDFYYQLLPKVMLTGYIGLETVKGNKQTDIDKASGLDSTVVSAADRKAYVATNLPRNQLETSYSVGFDFDIAKNVGLYIRQRWFDCRDKNFSLDHFKGTETFIELKMFF